MPPTNKITKPLKTRQVRCPTCGALPSDYCHSEQHHRSKNFHMARVRRAAINRRIPALS